VVPSAHATLLDKLPDDLVSDLVHVIRRYAHSAATLFDQGHAVGVVHVAKAGEYPCPLSEQRCDWGGG
jgi:hypothetical protein